MTVRITKLELEQRLVAQGKELEGLRLALSIAKAEAEMFARSAHNAIARADGLNPVTGQPAKRAYTPRALPAHFIAAREAAMRMGVVTKVTA